MTLNNEVPSRALERVWGGAAPESLQRELAPPKLRSHPAPSEIARLEVSVLNSPHPEARCVGGGHVLAQIAASLRKRPPRIGS